MRIGLIIYDDLNSVSGGYLYDRMLVDHLKHRGDTVDIISLPRRNYCRHLLHNYSRQLNDRLLNADLDLLLQDELNHPSLFLLNRKLRRNASYPVISIVHHLRCSEPHDWRNVLYRDVERRYVRSVDGFIFVSDHTARSVDNIAPVRVPSVVAYPGKDRFSRYETVQSVRGRVSQLEQFNILSVGNVIPRKGLHVLVEALAALKDTNWRLEVAGDPSCDRAYTHFLRRRIERAGLKERIRFRGAVSDTELVRLLRQSHLVAMPSLHEGFGIVYLEALGFGVPVIASSSGGAAEIIAHGEEGFLLAPGDVRSLVGHIERLNDDRHLLLAMSLNALEKHKRFPTWYESGSLIRGFLEGFIKKRRIILPEYEFGFVPRQQKQESLLH